MEHPAAPFRVLDDTGPGGAGLAVVDATGRVLAHIYTAVLAKETAALFAAAPDLLAALERTVRMAEAFAQDMISGREDAVADCKAARDAIAKAGGA